VQHSHVDRSPLHGDRGHFVIGKWGGSLLDVDASSLRSIVNAGLSVSAEFSHPEMSLKSGIAGVGR